MQNADFAALTLQSLNNSISKLFAALLVTKFSSVLHRHWARSIVRRLIRRRIRLILFPLDSEQFQPPAVRRVSRDFWRLIVEPRWRLKEAKGKLWHFLTKYSCFCCVKWQEFAEYKKCVENCTFFHRKCTKIQHF